MKIPSSGGGWQAIRYTLRKGQQVGGLWKLWKAMRSKNACKTCALGMGGQQGGMVNERGSFPEVCKKSLQAMAADMQDGITAEFWQRYSIAELQAMTPRELEACGRLVSPMIVRRGDTHYQAITWEEAYSILRQELRASAPSESFWYFSGRSSNEAGFLLQLFARLYGTNNVNNCSYYCHQASGVGLTSSIGTGTATIVLEDVEHADLVFVIGGNPPSNHPRLMSSLKLVRRRGGEVIVINPVVEPGLVSFRVPSDPVSLLFGTKIATYYIQPHIGGDLALLTGVAKQLLEDGKHDEVYLRTHCDNLDAWKRHLQELAWDQIVESSGVERDAIQRIAAKYANAKKVVFSWTMGITHHEHGVENVQAIVNLALARGMLGKPYAGLMPIRGHSNVQGIGSVGVTPKLKDFILERLTEKYAVKLPVQDGMDTLACMEAANRGEIRFALCLGGNLYGSNPDSKFAQHALSRIDTVCYLSTTLNTGHAYGLGRQTIILPVLARDEEPEPTTQESMFNYVRLSDGGQARHQGPRSEVRIIARLGQEVLGNTTPLDFAALASTGNIRQMIADVIPGWEKIRDIDRSKQEFHIDGRTLHTPRFPTANGRAQLFAHRLPPSPQDDADLRLMTVRSEGQFNTVVYEEEDIYRGQDRRDVILIHPEDMRRLAISHDQRVTVRNKTGMLLGIRARNFPNIRPGNALMYYPEANVLVPRTADRQSRTPSFKNIGIWIDR